MDALSCSRRHRSIGGRSLRGSRSTLLLNRGSGMILFSMGSTNPFGMCRVYLAETLLRKDVRITPRAAFALTGLLHPSK